MSHLELIAHMKIRPGQMERFKARAAELVRLTRERDTQTIRYDWFIDEAAMECEVHELYLSEQGLIEHNQHIMEARGLLFQDAASDHRMAVFGAISPELASLFDKHAGGVSKFSFVQGLQAAPAAEPM
jgi:quinol monooxygenase YgiN